MDIDTILKKAQQSMLRTLAEHVDVEKRLKEIKRRAALNSESEKK